MTDFAISNTALGQSLQLTKSGVSMLQTPIVLSGSGPYVLSGDEFVAALSSALVVRAELASSTITITLPATTTIINVISNQSVSRSITGAPTPFTGTNQSVGAWVSLKIINNNASFPVSIVAGDGSTNVIDQQTLPLTTQTYTVYESLVPMSSQVTVVQNAQLAVYLQPEYVTGYMNNTQHATSSTAYAVRFTDILNASPTDTSVAYFPFPPNQLIISSNVTALITCTLTILNGTNATATYNLQLAPVGQFVAPVSGAIAGSGWTCFPNDQVIMSFSVVYTNNSPAQTIWQVYLTGHDTVGLQTFIESQGKTSYQPQLTAVQIL